MNPDIHLVFNHGFQWHSHNGCHVKGFAFTEGGTYLKDRELAAHFRNTEDFEEFNEKISSLNGLFSVVLQQNEITFAAVDPIRTFPLFYASGPEGLVLSDSVDTIRGVTGNKELQPLASAEFLATGFVSGPETLTSGISQVQAGEINEFPSNPLQSRKSHFYSSYRTRNTFNPGEAELRDHLGSVTDNIFKRLIRSLENRTAVIALSGGYDSRFIAAQLKQMEYEKVICYSYGRQGNRDMELSGRVAAGLGLEWISIVYTEELINGYIDDPEFPDYVKYSANHTSMFFLQEYFAVKYLKDNQLIPEDSIFVPGHSADFFAGSQHIKHGLHAGPESMKATVERLYNVKYSICSPSTTDKTLLKDRILNSLQQKSTFEGAHPYSMHEDWDLKEKLAKFIVNSNNVYSFFGYEYRLPFYDREFHDFFRDLAFEMKSDKQLYDTFLVEGIFSELSLNFTDEIQPSEKQQRMANLKNMIKRSLPPGFIPRNPPVKDPIFYHEITRILKEDLAKRGIRIRVHGKTYNSIIIQWYLEFLKIK